MLNVKLVKTKSYKLPLDKTIDAVIKCDVMWWVKNKNNNTSQTLISGKKKLTLLNILF